MKTSDELWRWIWEDEDVLDEDVLRDLLGGEDTPAGPSALVPPPRVTSEDVWTWIASDEDLIDRELLDLAEPEPYPPEPEPYPPEEPSASASEAEEPSSAEASGSPAPTAEPSSYAASGSPAPTAEPSSYAASGSPEEAADEEPVGAEPSRGPRLAWGRRARFAALLALTALVGTVATRVVPAVLPGAGTDGATGAPPPEQLVVAWTIRMEETPGATFVAVLAAGAKPPIAVAVPSDVTINVPGQGLGTVGEAAATGDPQLVGVALENLIGVRIDASIASGLPEVQAGVDALGTIEVSDQALNGGQAVQYLTTLEPGALPDERFLRWQDVLDGILRAIATRPEAVAGFPEPLRPVLQASSPEPADLYGLPVVDLGAGLLRPDQKALEQLVDDRFLRPPADEVRLVVLNGVGNPGIGGEVARILVPEGYRLMASTNANTFDLPETKIIAASDADLASAERARALLGVGRVFLGFQPAGLADVTVVVGQDFVAAHHLGGA